MIWWWSVALEYFPEIQKKRKLFYNIHLLYMVCKSVCMSFSWDDERYSLYCFFVLQNVIVVVGSYVINAHVFQVFFHLITLISKERNIYSTNIPISGGQKTSYAIFLTSFTFYSFRVFLNGGQWQRMPATFIFFQSLKRPCIFFILNTSTWSWYSV